jgi:NADH-quinone oxidoreductase subunit L
VVGTPPEENLPVPAFLISVLAVIVVAAGVALAWFLVGRREVPLTAPTDVSFATRAARADLYGDAINEGLVVQPGRRLVHGLVGMDSNGVDGVLTGGPLAVGVIAGQVRRVQNGFVRSYALSLLGGVLLVVLALLAVNLA